ncbi:MAG: bifunctional riboflavin kinase/FMN adenylyltransferase [Candidatus Margulisiibacteriota bacterium]|jgi:riboflavin kinase/FMN adenylyltransferase
MILALGVFDGVHLGHQQVIAKADKVLTFDPHPNSGAHLLTTLEERKKLIPNLVVLPFDKHLSMLTPEGFVKEVLVGQFKASKVVVGYDFAFGYNREGHTSDLVNLGRKYGFEVEVIPVFMVDEIIPKSSTIRNLLGMGEVEEAASLLGRNYSVTGIVGKGKQLGRELGFPTANLELPENKLIPAEGVYLGQDCLINIGEIMEVHILEFSGDLYGQSLTVEFFKRLRPEIEFTDHRDLIAQVEKDIALAKKMLPSLRGVPHRATWQSR